MNNSITFYQYWKLCVEISQKLSRRSILSNHATKETTLCNKHTTMMMGVYRNNRNFVRNHKMTDCDNCSLTIVTQIPRNPYCNRDTRGFYD
jgi:hypothetical protein